MAITASMVKELRVATGAGMMDCKKALSAVDGDMDAAMEFLRKKGLAGADKKASRVAAEGIIAITVSEDKKKAVIAEVNCETDFVAKGDEFQSFANEIATIALTTGTIDVVALMGEKMSSGTSIDVKRRELIAKIGENMSIRRVAMVESTGQVGQYQHGEKIGVVVCMEGGDETLSRDIAMHIAAVNPQAVSSDDLDQSVVEKERKFQIEQAQSSGKPPEIIEKMIAGRMRKFTQDITLLGQGFVKNPDKTIAKLLEEKNASVATFTRLVVGEGIEKKELSFADEVAAVAAAVQG